MISVSKKKSTTVWQFNKPTNHFNCKYISTSIDAHLLPKQKHETITFSHWRYIAHDTTIFTAYMPKTVYMRLHSLNNIFLTRCFTDKTFFYVTICFKEST